MSYRNVMPWGKHKGRPLADVPGSYLFWVLEECESVDASLQRNIREELARRLPKPPPSQPPSIIDRSYILAWCRRAALACHPDHGGSVAAMKLVNELRSMV